MEVNGALTHADRPRAAQSGPQTLRQAAYAVLEEGQIETTGSRIVEGILVSLILANVAAVALESVPSIANGYQRFFRAFELISIAAYTAEYVARVWSSLEDPRIAER